MRRTLSVKSLFVLAMALVMPGTIARPVLAQDSPPSVSHASQTPPARISEPRALTRAIDFVDDKATQGGVPGNGFYPEFGNMITGAGWISVGPGYRRRLFDNRMAVNVSGAVSLNFYKMMQGRVEFPHLAKDRLAVGAQVMYQDLLHMNYFGLGSNSAKSDRSGYRLNETDVSSYATVTPTTWLSVSGRFGWIRSPDVSAMTGRSVSYPNTLDVFSDATAPGLNRQPAFLHGDISVSADTRDHPGHATRGGLYRATGTSYSDRASGQYSFRRYEVEGAQYIPLTTDRWILALHAWEVFSDTSGGNSVPFYLMPSLGGRNTLRGYLDYRFHDLNMQIVNIESRWGLLTHLDVAAFVDAGKVAPVASGLDFRHLKTSYGAGVRLHNSASTFTRLDVAHSAEGWQIVFKMNDSFKRSTLAGGRSEAMPFVP